MNFTDIFIKKPVLAIVVSLLILLAGFQSMSNMTVRQYPRSDIAVIKITTVYVGANAELVRGFITTPIERAIASAGGIDYIESQSTMGMSTITAHLQLNYDPLKAMTEISAKVNQVRGELPPEAEVPSLAIEAADSQFAQAYLSFSSDILEQNQITEFLSRSVQPRLIAISGVQKADILGGRTFAMRVWLKPERMAALGITASDVRTALTDNNIQATIGQTRGAYTQVNLRANTDMKGVDEFKRMILRQNSDGIVRLSDVADVVLGADDYNTNVNYSGETAVFMGVFVAPNANSLDVIKAVTKEMEQIKADLPSGLTGEGRMADPEAILEFLSDELKKKLPLKGKKALVTAGPTYEAIDPVRFIGNHASGLMGFQLAEQAASLGAKVTLVSGPSHLNVQNPLIKKIKVVSAADMLHEVLHHFDTSDIVIMAAAVADYKPRQVASQKVKKSDATWVLELEKTTDILFTLGQQKKHQLLVGFALETNNEIEHANQKLTKKNLDFIVLNSLNDVGAGFGVSTNKNLFIFFYHPNL